MECLPNLRDWRSLEVDDPHETVTGIRQHTGLPCPGRSRMYCATIATTAMRSSLPLGRLTTICSVPAGSNTGGFPGFQCTTVPLKISVMTYPQSLL